MTDRQPDQLDVMCHLATATIRREADARWLEVAMWQPAPMPADYLQDGAR